ncbi:MAG: hypothetical protein DRJ60_05995 [Thermoprotei archaeon]|nr:MAG: hypothetical protein DRJ60_05995 [Thermoprotei archaeon]
MLFVSIFRYPPENRDKLVERFRSYRRPEGVKVLGRYTLLGRHTIITIFDVEDVNALKKIVHHFSDLGTYEIYPAVPTEEAYEKIW